MNAAQKGHADVVKLLLDKGADRSAKRKDGSTSIDDALGSGESNVLGLLLDKSNT